MGSSFSFSSPERLSGGPVVVAGVSAPSGGPGVATGCPHLLVVPGQPHRCPHCLGTRQGRRVEYPNLQLGGSAWEKFRIIFSLFEIPDYFNSIQVGVNLFDFILFDLF